MFNLVITKQIYNTGTASETSILTPYVDNVVKTSVITGLQPAHDIGSINLIQNISHFCDIKALGFIPWSADLNERNDLNTWLNTI